MSAKSLFRMWPLALLLGGGMVAAGVYAPDLFETYLPAIGVGVVLLFAMMLLFLSN